MLLFISILETVCLGIVSFTFGFLALDRSTNKGNGFVRDFSIFTLLSCLLGIVVIWILYGRI